MFDWLFDLLKRAARALIPIRNFDTQAVTQMVRSPIETKKLLDKKKAAIILLDEAGGIDIVGGIKYANVVLNPSLGKEGMGWIIGKTHTFQHKIAAYICHPRIPYTLGISEEAFHSAQILNKSLTAEKRLELGLPDDLEQLLPETLSQIVITKWQAGFDERSGNLQIWFFGAFVGFAGGIVAAFIFILMISLGSHK
ncbi:Uncharacterised protein [uncultured archaeon]|nr:Uncharacterised protein [uncultured archaeon]